MFCLQGRSRSELDRRLHFSLNWIDVTVDLFSRLTRTMLVEGSEHSRFSWQSGLPKEWSEDPAIVSINAVIVYYRIIFTAGGHSNERPTGTFITT